MPAWAVILASAIAGIVPGAILLTLLTILYLAVFSRETLNRGCSMAMLLQLFTVPIGGLVGAAAAAAIAYWWLGSPLIAGWLWIAGGLLILALVWLFTWGGRPGHSEPPWLWIAFRSGERLPDPDAWWPSERRTPAAVPSDNQQPLTPGGELLLKTQDAYAALSSYVGTSVSSVIADGPSPFTDATASAKVTFSRPKLRIEGTTTPVYPWDPTSGTPFTIISDGHSTWQAWTLLNDGRFSPVPSVQEAISAVAGISLDAGTTIPMLLLQIPGLHDDRSRRHKQFLEVWADGARLEQREDLDGTECYRIISNRQIETYTFWVNCEDFLLRQMEFRQNTASETHRERFIIESTNSEVDAQLFQDPTH